MLIFDADDTRDSLVFMHVPKCAGAAIHSHLEKRLRRRRDGRVRVMWGVRGDVDLARLRKAQLGWERNRDAQGNSTFGVALLLQKLSASGSAWSTLRADQVVQGVQQQADFWTQQR